MSKDTSQVRALCVTEFCELGTVPETVKFEMIQGPPPPKGDEVHIQVKAASINVGECSGDI